MANLIISIHHHLHIMASYINLINTIFNPKSFKVNLKNIISFQHQPQIKLLIEEIKELNLLEKIGSKLNNKL